LKRSGGKQGIREDEMISFRIFIKGVLSILFRFKKHFTGKLTKYRTIREYNKLEMERKGASISQRDSLSQTLYYRLEMNSFRAINIDKS